MTRKTIKQAVLILLLSGTSLMAGACGDAASERTRDDAREAVGTAGERARELGKEVGERTEAAAEQTREAVAEGTITSKIKGKMALDETVNALDIRVETEGSTVTLSGVVATAAERDQALKLARETEGVTKVVDNLRVGR